MNKDNPIAIRVLGTTFQLSPRDVENAFAATEESEWLGRPGVEPYWNVVVEGKSKPVKAVFRRLPGIPADFEFNKDAAARAFEKLGFEVINTREAAPPGELCLLGTWRDVSEERVVGVRASVANKGGWASWWSFPIREEFQRQLQTPFYLYVNAGGGRFPFRMRVEKFETVRGNEGIASPWPEITDSEYIGQVRSGPKNSHIFKTWLYVSELEALQPPLTLDDFQPAPGVSRDALLNQRAFGYAYVRSGGLKTVAAVPTVATNLILYGPPGTGKTHWMREKIREYQQAGPEEERESAQRYRIVTFHPSYSYEDFVRGIRPVTTAEDGTTQFRLVDGVFMQICDEARVNPAKRYALFIDEINRANIAKVFGELITLIEPDKRAVYDTEGRLKEGLAVQLPGGDGNHVAEPPFGVPANLDIFGTMNTADRSIALLDVALRRRFEFREMEPDYEVINRSVEGVHLGRLLNRINDRLEYLLDRDHRIGHAYLIGARSISDLQRIIRVQVIPLLQEYFFDDLARVALVLATSASARFVRRERLLRGNLFSGERIDGVAAERARYIVTPASSWTSESFAGIYSAAEPAVEEEVEE
jgi:hypothetical protein